MSKHYRSWLVLTLIYAIFFLWYTDLGGKLNSAEIEIYLVKLQENSKAKGVLSPEALKVSKVTFKKIEKFMREDSGKQFLMVNNIDMSENPENIEGAQQGETANQLMDRYMEHMYPELLKRASHPIFFGNSILQAVDIVGIENAEDWDSIALMRYKSRRAFMEVVSNPKILGKHEFKVAALDKTIAYPVEPFIYLSDPRMLLAFILTIMGLALQLKFRE